MARQRDAWHRRQVLRRLGGLSLGWPVWERIARAGQAPTPKPIRACIMIFYYGGPSHLDTFDLKPDAPAEVRGEFQPIATSVPGVRVCEHLPLTAKVMHHVAVVRSMHHANRLHDSASIETLTGRLPPQGDQELFSPVPQVFPCYSAALSYLRRDQRLTLAHAALPFLFHNVVDVPCQGGGFLGRAYDPFLVQVGPAARAYHADLLQAAEGASPQRRATRRNLLESLGMGPDAGLKHFHDRAHQLLDSEAIRRALDLSREDPRTRARYGFGDPPAQVGEGGGGGNGAELGYARPMRSQNLLLARRLVEAGVTFINVNDFHQQGQNWDAHFKCFNQHKSYLLPQADRGLSALIEDLDARGLLDSTLVVALGEFGRTPRINGEGGRDHWPDCYSIVLAGGGVRGGTLHGASDRFGAYPASDPVTPADLAATIYWRFGYDPKTEVRDALNRPFPLSTGEPIKAIFG